MSIHRTFSAQMISICLEKAVESAVRGLALGTWGDW